MNRHLKLFLALLVVSGVVAGCGGKDKILVYMKGKDITVNEFKEEIEKVQDPYYKGFLSTPGGKKQYLDGIIEERVLLARARKEGVYRKKEYKERLKEMKSRLLIGYMMEELMKNYLTVTEKDIDEYYEKQKEEFLNPEEIQASHILLQTKEDAEEVMSKLRQGVGFEDLAKQYSIDSVTAGKGGTLGAFGKGDMVPEFEQAAFKLKKSGDISDIVKTQFGYHIIKLIGRTRKSEKTRDEAREEIVKQLQRGKLQNLMSKYKREMRVKVKYELIDSMTRMPEKMPVPPAGNSNPEGEWDENKK